MQYYYGQKYPLISFTKNLENHFNVSVTLHKTDKYRLVFMLLDPSESVLIPHERVKPSHERTIGLWENTCFEFFIRDQKDHSVYCEGNFALDFSWNIFWFNSYRQSPLTEFAAEKLSNPIRDIFLSGKKSEIVIDIPEELLSKFSPNSLEFSFTAVVKTKDSKTHYLALKHSDALPNFHHPDSFSLFLDKT